MGRRGRPPKQAVAVKVTTSGSTELGNELGLHEVAVEDEASQGISVFEERFQQIGSDQDKKGKCPESQLRGAGLKTRGEKWVVVRGEAKKQDRLKDKQGMIESGAIRFQALQGGEEECSEVGGIVEEDGDGIHRKRRETVSWPGKAESRGNKEAGISGERVTEPKEIQRMVLDFYMEMIGTSSQASEEMDRGCLREAHEQSLRLIKEQLQHLGRTAGLEISFRAKCLVEDSVVYAQFAQAFVYALEEESHDHVFCQCLFATAVLRGVMLYNKLHPREFTWEYLTGWMMKIGKGRSQRAEMVRRQFAAALYEIWIEQNSRIFRNISAGPDVIIKKVLSLIKL
ncbi:hypothetical protein Dimus_004353 [Dionaea muscipula]